MQKKDPSKPFFRILFLLFLSFIIIYLGMSNGYYESKVGNKAYITDEAVKKFEEDVKNGKEIKIDSYIKEEPKDYSNSITKAGNALSETVSSFFSEGLVSIFGFLKKMFW